MVPEAEVAISAPLHLGWLIVVILIQAGVDTLYTLPLFALTWKQRFLLFTGSGTIGVGSIAMMLRLLYPVLTRILLNARDDGRYFGLWVLGTVLFYVFLGVVGAGIKGSMVWLLASGSMNDEKQHKWWNYTFIGNVVTVLLASPSFFIITFLPILVATLPEENG